MFQALALGQLVKTFRALHQAWLAAINTSSNVTTNARYKSMVTKADLQNLAPWPSTFAQSRSRAALQDPGEGP